MLFEDFKEIKYRKYSADTVEVSRHIEIKKAIAEEINKVIAVVNKENKGVKINNTILFNLAIKKYFKELAELPSEEAIKLLKTSALEEAGLN